MASGLKLFARFACSSAASMSTQLMRCPDPIKDCPHANVHAQALTAVSAELAAALQKCQAAGCDNAKENWFCLTCHTVLCGRFAHGHMLEHKNSTGHCIAMGLDDISFWFARYSCASSISLNLLGATSASSTFTTSTTLRFIKARRSIRSAFAICDFDVLFSLRGDPQAQIRPSPATEGEWWKNPAIAL